MTNASVGTISSPVRAKLKSWVDGTRERMRLKRKKSAIKRKNSSMVSVKPKELFIQAKDSFTGE